MNPETTQILNALPQQWQFNIILTIGLLHFVITHGGFCGLWEVIKHGKKPISSTSTPNTP